MNNEQDTILKYIEFFFLYTHVYFVYRSALKRKSREIWNVTESGVGGWEGWILDSGLVKLFYMENFWEKKKDLKEMRQQARRIYLGEEFF